MKLRAPHTLSLLLLLTAPALTQGADDCANAQPITGTGIFTYDTHGTTTDGPQEAFWAIPGLYDMHNDVWFAWTAPSSGVFEISTCFSQTQWAATFMAVYEFGCPGGPGRAVEARGAYDCGLFTIFELGATEGTTYLIRLGHSAAQNTDDGQFEIREVAPPAVLDTVVNPANGRTYHFLEHSSWGVAQAAAKALGGNLVTVNDQAENDWLGATFSNWGGTPRSFWIGYTDKANEGVWEWVSGETPGYENWSGSPNNGNQYEHYAHFRKDWTDGTWNDLLGFPQVSFFYNEVHGVVEVGAESIGTNYCGPANLNSSGQPGVLSGYGSEAAAQNNVRLDAAQLSLNQFSYFITSQTQGFVIPPGSQGNLCLGGTIGRFNASVLDTGATGEVSLQLDLTDFPVGNGVAVQPGETWLFQLWYRDANPTPTSNFTDGLSVTFH